MEKAKLFYLIENSWVSYELKESIKSAINNINYVQVDSERVNSMILLENPWDWKKINTLKQIISHSLSVILDYETQVLDTLKDHFLLALQDYPIELIEKALNVLDSYYSDVRQDKSLRKWADTKAISRIRNLCTVFWSFDIYDILKNRVEFIDYHLVNSRSDSVSQESRLDWAKVKNYYVIKDKNTWNIIIVGDSIQLLYKDFNVPMPSDSLSLKNNRIEVVKKAKFRSLNSKLKWLSDEWKYENNKEWATKALLSNWINGDLLISRWLLQKLDEISIKIEKWEYWELIKSFNPKRNYINWLIENKSHKELPKYIVELINKLVSLNEELSSQEMLILFSYYARESTIYLESIPNIVNNIKYFIKEWAQISIQVQSLLWNKEINQIQLLQILDNVWAFLIQAKSLNLETIKSFESLNKIKFKEIIKTFFPLVLQTRNEYSKDMLYFNLVIGNSADKSNLSTIKNLIKVWTIWINNIDDFDFGNKLINNICWIESIDNLNNYLNVFLFEYRKYIYCLSLNKPFQSKISSYIDENVSSVDIKSTWSQLNTSFKKDIKSKFALQKLPSKLMKIEDLKDENWSNIDYFQFTNKVSKTYFPSNTNTSIYINWVILSLSNFTKYGLFPLEKLPSFLNVFNFYNRQWFEPKLDENKYLYDDFEFFMWFGSFISTMHYPKSILTKDYINPWVTDKIQQIVNTCKEYFGWASKDEITNLYNLYLELNTINQHKNIVFYGNSSNPYSTYFLLSENVFPVEYRNVNWVRFVNTQSIKTKLNVAKHEYISFEQVKIQHPELINELDKILAQNDLLEMRISIDHKSLSAFRDLIIWPHNNGVLVPIKLINVVLSIVSFYKK